MIFLYVALAALLLPLSFILYRSYQGWSVYKRAVKAFGKSNVVYFNRSYLKYSVFFSATEKNGMDSMFLYNEAVRKNPDVKIIVTSLLQSVFILVCDPELIRKITHEYSRNHQKRKFLMFADQLEKGLIFSEGETWKKSRAIISNLFHFEMLKNREAIMHSVTA